MLYISNVQHFSVGDGAGIRTTVFFKGCNLRCPWCHNPENLTRAPVTLHYTNGKTETLGRAVSAEALLPELLEDRDFYETSGGGVTLSGGEVMLQSEAAAELAKLLYENGISVLIDTAGCVPYQHFEALNPFISGYLFDFKTASEEKYQTIGGSLSLVTENIRRLLHSGIPLRIRIPLIPHFNADERSAHAIGAYLRALGIKEADLIPFHRLGSAKYEAMKLDYAYCDQPPLDKEALAALEKIYKQYFSIKTER